jgi:hypothetical protein
MIADIAFVLFMACILLTLAPQHSILSPRSSLKLRKISEPSSDQFELRARARLFLILIPPALFVCMAVVFYALLIA